MADGPEERLIPCTLTDCADWRRSVYADRQGGCSGHSIWPLEANYPEEGEPYTAEHKCCGYHPVYRAFLWPSERVGVVGPGDMPEWCEGRRQWRALEETDD